MAPSSVACDGIPAPYFMISVLQHESRRNQLNYDSTENCEDESVLIPDFSSPAYYVSWLVCRFSCLLRYLLYSPFLGSGLCKSTTVRVNFTATSPFMAFMKESIYLILNNHQPVIQ